MIITGILKDLFSEISKLTFNYFNNTKDRTTEDISALSENLFTGQQRVSTRSITKCSFNEETSSLLREFQAIPDDKALSTFTDLLREGTLIIPKNEISQPIKKTYIDFVEKMLSKDAQTVQKVAVTFLNRVEIPEPSNADIQSPQHSTHFNEPWDKEISIEFRQNLPA